MPISPEHFAAGVAVAVTVYFWSKNIIGMHESSEKALHIMQITTVMVVMLIVWCLITIFRMPQGPYPFPLPSRETIKFGADALGWIPEHWPRSFTFLAFVLGLGHSLLPMSGKEGVAQ